MHDELRPGDRVVAVVRPEDVALSAPADGADHVNRVEALIEDRINVGGQVRAVARTPGGLELVAQGPRSALSGDETHLQPGQLVELSWEPGAVHAYAAPDAVGSGREDAAPPREAEARAG